VDYREQQLLQNKVEYVQANYAYLKFDTQLATQCNAWNSTRDTRCTYCCDGVHGDTLNFARREVCASPRLDHAVMAA
jgi:hypothetical protein